MKKITVSLGLILTLSFGTTFNDGYEAFEKGDYQSALSIYEYLAAKNDSKALYNLGDIYSHGYGVKQDYKIAKELYKKACDGGIQIACYHYRLLN